MKYKFFQILFAHFLYKVVLLDLFLSSKPKCFLFLETCFMKVLKISEEFLLKLQCIIKVCFQSLNKDLVLLSWMKQSEQQYKLHSFSWISFGASQVKIIAMYQIKERELNLLVRCFNFISILFLKRVQNPLVLNSLNNQLKYYLALSLCEAFIFYVYNLEHSSILLESLKFVFTQHFGSW